MQKLSPVRDIILEGKGIICCDFATQIMPLPINKQVFLSELVAKSERHDVAFAFASITDFEGRHIIGCRQLEPPNVESSTKFPPQRRFPIIIYRVELIITVFVGAMLV